MATIVTALGPELPCNLYEKGIRIETVYSRNGSEVPLCSNAVQGSTKATLLSQF